MNIDTTKYDYEETAIDSELALGPSELEFLMVLTKHHIDHHTNHDEVADIFFYRAGYRHDQVCIGVYYLKTSNELLRAANKRRLEHYIYNVINPSETCDPDPMSNILSGILDGSIEPPY